MPAPEGDRREPEVKRHQRRRRIHPFFTFCRCISPKDVLQYIKCDHMAGGKRGEALDTVYEEEIMRGVRLTAVRADRFKTGCLSLTLLAPHTKKTAAMNAALPYVLRRGTARFPDMESLAGELDALYGARIEPAIRKKGEVAALGFCADFPDGAYLPGRTDVLSGVVSLMGELLLAPATRGGRLRGDYVLSERRNLIDDINAEINDKRAYASLKLVEAMFRGENYALGKLGTAADAGKISAMTLTRYYRELIACAPVEVFYCGPEEPERVARAVREALAAMPRTGAHARPVTERGQGNERAGEKRLRETMDVTQGRLVMGFRLSEDAMGRGPAALGVFNALFGGSPTSRLFLKVREEQALCYYVSSRLDMHKGALFVSAGIDFDGFDRVHGQVVRELASLAAGECLPWELEGAKRGVTGAILAALDDPVGLEGMYLDRAILGLAARPEELAALCELVTAEDVAAVAAGARLTHTYFLTAEEKDA